MAHPATETLECDLLILGSGGAGLLAALHGNAAGPESVITLAAKGLFGKSGCTRMVQGGYNAVLDPRDSLELHFRDTLKGGAFLNDQELAWTLVEGAPRCLRELEEAVGCFFDRNPDGSIHQKAFAGQSFDRTVHRGDLTGIEIVSRLAEQVSQRPLRILEEHRALALLPDEGTGGIGGALLVDVRTGRFLVARARATLLATGGGPTMYRVTAASADKAMDGVAMAYRAGAELLDMEMVQFHPTGLLAAASLISGTVLEEGLRGAGGRLLNGRGERFMARYDPVRLERATRDVVARASYLEIMAGRGTPSGGVYLDVSHLGAEFVESRFPGMARRCRDVGYDLARGPVEVSPTAHYHMGGVRITPECRSTLAGLYVAGEDAGGIHGANRLGGNGVADSTVFGCRAGEAMAADVLGRPRPALSEAAVREAVAAACAPLARAVGEGVYPIREAMRSLLWEKVGLVRNGPDLEGALLRVEGLRERLEAAGVAGSPAYNRSWQDWHDVQNHLLVSEMIVRAALLRTESRGAHYRSDYPERDDDRYLKNTVIRREDGGMRLAWRPVRFTRLTREALAVQEAAAGAAGRARRPEAEAVVEDE